MAAGYVPLRPLAGVASRRLALMLSMRLDPSDSRPRPARSGHHPSRSHDHVERLNVSLDVRNSAAGPANRLHNITATNSAVYSYRYTGGTMATAAWSRLPAG